MGTQFRVLNTYFLIIIVEAGTINVQVVIYRWLDGFHLVIYLNLSVDCISLRWRDRSDTHMQVSYRVNNPHLLISISSQFEVFQFSSGSSRILLISTD